MTFTVVGNLADFGAQPRAGVRVRANATPTVKVAGGVVYSDATETALTDAAGAFTLTLVSIPGAWFTVRTDYGETNPATFAGYVPDTLDPTTGVPLAPGTVIQLADVVTEAPTPGYAVTVGPTGATGATGATGPAGTPPAFELRGSGSPEGTVTAAVGTYYTDTAGTNGAWRWLKRAGAGNTGWGVVIGDTGSRHMQSLLLNGWGLINAGVHPQLSRNTDLVTLVLPGLGLTGAAATASIFMALPSGFRLANSGNYGHVGWASNGATVAMVTKDFNNLSSPARGPLEGIFQWTTADAWPTTLPGTTS